MRDVTTDRIAGATGRHNRYWSHHRRTRPQITDTGGATGQDHRYWSHRTRRQILEPHQEPQHIAIYRY